MGEAGGLYCVVHIIIEREKTYIGEEEKKLWSYSMHSSFEHTH